MNQATPAPTKGLPQMARNARATAVPGWRNTFYTCARLDLAIDTVHHESEAHAWFVVLFRLCAADDNGSNLRALVSSCGRLGPAPHPHTVVMACVQK
jgi:hypothetical protein